MFYLKPPSELVDYFRKKLDPYARVLAVSALAERYDAIVYSHLRKAIDDPYDVVRLRAAEALAQRQDPESAELLRQFGRRMPEEDLRLFLKGFASGSLLEGKNAAVLLEGRSLELIEDLLESGNPSFRILGEAHSVLAMMKLFPLT